MPPIDSDRGGAHIKSHLEQNGAPLLATTQVTFSLRGPRHRYQGGDDTTSRKSPEIGFHLLQPEILR